MFLPPSGPREEPPDVGRPRRGGGPQGEDRQAGGAHGQDTDREPDPQGARAQRGGRGWDGLPCPTNIARS